MVSYCLLRIPTLPSPCKQGEERLQALEIVTNSPNLGHHCEMIPHGSLPYSLTYYKQQFAA